jgi:hypothetical protein
MEDQKPAFLFSTLEIFKFTPVPAFSSVNAGAGEKLRV